MAIYKHCFDPKEEDIETRHRRPTLDDRVQGAGHTYSMEPDPEQASLGPRSRTRELEGIEEPSDPCPAIPLGNRQGLHKLGDNRKPT